MRDLDARFARAVPPAEQAPTSLARLLRARGAPDECVLFSEDGALDGRALRLDEALGAVVGRGMGTFVSCIPGRLAYFEAEGPGQRYVLERAS
jgi:hypothetical protein